MSKKNYSLIAVFILLLIFMNVQIFQKEEIKSNGESIYFKLRPVDPRAFMLGDYMSLNFDHNLRNTSDQNMQTFIVTLDSDNIVTHSESYSDQNLLPNQRLFNIQDQLRPDRFYFQEGHASAYDQGKYAQFKYLSSDDFLIETLTDDKLNPIIIDSK